MSEQTVYCDKWIDPEAIEAVQFDLLRAVYDDIKRKVEQTVGERPVVGRPVLHMRYELQAEFAEDEIVLYRELPVEPAPLIRVHREDAEATP